MTRCPTPALLETAVQHPELTGGEHWGSNLPGVQPDAVQRHLTSLKEGVSSASSARHTAEHLDSLYQQQAQLIGVPETPKVDLLVFDEDSVKYFPVIRAFEDNIEREP